MRERILEGMKPLGCEIDEGLSHQEEDETSFMSAIRVLNECIIKGYNLIRKNLHCHLPLTDYLALTKSHYHITGTIL